jgi:hypothetical protein
MNSQTLRPVIKESMKKLMIKNNWELLTKVVKERVQINLSKNLNS